MGTVIHRLLFSVAATAALLLAYCGLATAGTFPVNICGTSPRDPGDGLSWSATSPLVAGPTCPSGGLGLSFYADAKKTLRYNATAAFKVTAPAGLAVYSIHVASTNSDGIGTSRFGSYGWWGEFYWNGGPGPAGRSGPLNDGQFNAGGCCSQTNLQSRTIGWFIACNQPTCSTGIAGIDRGMRELDLMAEEDQAPSILATDANNLWYQTGWVRGTWNASFTASDPSGVCGAAVVFGSLPAINTPTPDTAPNRHRWKQCPDQSVGALVDTSGSEGSSGLGEGAMQLRLPATNTAGVTANPTKTVYVDNSTPTISLSGPTDAPSTAGTQYVTVAGSGSPSGIAGFMCSTDGGPAQWFAGASAQVPVRGIGPHTVRCSAVNNAVDPAGSHGTSTPGSWSLKIGQPTVAGISFSRLAGLRCHRARVRLRIGGHWIKVRRHGHLVKVKTRTRTKLVRVMRCQPAHLIVEKARRVPFGHATTVNGWLGTSTGTALSGHIVHVLSAPDNGANQFTQAASVITASDGSWSARLRPGPSRIVEAVYDGDPTTESTSSGQVHLIVPAKVKLLRVSPHRVRWGSSVKITGQLLGGYLPPGGALLRLRIGTGGTYSTYGVQEHVTGNGRFTTGYTFGAGDAAIRRTYWFQLATLPMGNYPYAPAASARGYVLVGG